MYRFLKILFFLCLLQELIADLNNFSISYANNDDNINKIKDKNIIKNENKDKAIMQNDSKNINKNKKGEKAMGQITHKSIINEECKDIIFCFHGLGDSMEGFHPLTQLIQSQLNLKFTDLYTLNAPETYYSNDAFKWFDIEESFNDSIKNYMEVVPIIEQYIQKILDTHNKTWNDVILLGFSQGGGISFHLGCKHNVKAVCAFSGFYLPYEKNYVLKECKTKFYIAHGRMDNVCPIEMYENLVNEYKILKSNFSMFVDPYAQHQISEAMFKKCLMFLKEEIKVK